MPIEGRFYDLEELVLLMGVTKQRISYMFNDHAIKPGLYPAEIVEPYLLDRNINPNTLPVRTCDHPEGATRAQLEKEFDNDNNI